LVGKLLRAVGLTMDDVVRSPLTPTFSYSTLCGDSATNVGL
jgi:hypothetical protein